MTEPRPPRQGPGVRQGPGMPPLRGVAAPPAYRPGVGMQPPAPVHPDPSSDTVRIPLAAAGDPRAMRLAPDGRLVRAAADARPVRIKPDPNPLRMLIGFAGLATASAITTALLPSILPAPVDASAQYGTNAAALGPQPSVIHVQRTVQLAPGQTAPPNTSVQVAPQPTPQVHIQVVTRQSGKP